MTDTRPPANAFEWRRYVVEESIRRGDKDALNANNTSLKRSIASSRRVERNRLDTPLQANIAGMSKHEMDTHVTPKKFNVFETEGTKEKPKRATRKKKEPT